MSSAQRKPTETTEQLFKPDGFEQATAPYWLEDKNIIGCFRDDEKRTFLIVKQLTRSQGKPFYQIERHEDKGNGYFEKTSSAATADHSDLDCIIADHSH